MVVDFSFRQRGRRHRDENQSRDPGRRSPLEYAKHIELYRALGAEPPRRAHPPHPQSGRLEDEQARHRASLNTYIEEGFLPEAVRNYLCLLGWSPKDNREKIESMKSSGCLSSRKSIVITRHLISPNAPGSTANMSTSCRPNVSVPSPRLHWLRPELTRRNSRLITFTPRSIRAKGSSGFSANCPSMAVYFTDEIRYQPEGIAKHFVAENKPRLQTLRKAFARMENFDAASIEAALKATAAQLGVKAGALVHPTRLAVTGSNAGPSLTTCSKFSVEKKCSRARPRARPDPKRRQGNKEKCLSLTSSVIQRPSGVSFNPGCRG